jgi:hypothetical protein
MDAPIHMDMLIQEGDLFRLGEGVELRTLAVPGHKLEEVAFLETKSKSLLMGDLFLALKTPFFHGYQTSVGFHHSLARVQGLIEDGSIENVYPAHHDAMNADQALVAIRETRQFLDDITDATLAEATAAGGVVTVTAESGASTVVTFSRSGGGTVSKTVTGNGSTPVAVTLIDTELTALGNGKPVITANKALLAKHGDEIFAAAEASGSLGEMRSVGRSTPSSGCRPRRNAFSNSWEAPWKPRRVRPKLRPISGNRLGPKTIKAIAAMTASSGRPMPKMFMVGEP